MKRYSLCLLLIVFLTPSIAFASWWNPFSWFKKQVIQPPVVQVSIPTPNSVNDKKVEKEKVVLKKEKQETKSTSKQITPTSSLPVSGGGAGMGFSGGQPFFPPKCSVFKKIFFFFFRVEFFKKISSANRDGVEIEPPLYTLCMQCLTSTPSIPINNSTSSQILPVNAGCDSGTGFSSITGVLCNSTTSTVSNATSTVSIPITTIKRKNKIQPTTISIPTPQPTYKELHCPQITTIKDSLGNVGHSPFQGAGIKGSFTKGEISSITLEITATDPQGLPVYFKISSDWPNDSTDWSLKNAYTFDVSNSSKGVHIVAVEIDNHDDFNCISGRGDALRQLEYSVY